MKCPVDGETLLMTQRSGVEIDYCPKCRGVWLDRGELDKILEREDEIEARRDSDRDRDDRREHERGYEQNRGYDNRNSDQNRGYDPNRGYDRERRDEVNPLDLIKDALGKSGSRGYEDRGYDNRGYDNRGYDSRGYKKKKKGGLLGDLFDF